MLDLLLYSSIACADADALVLRIKAHEDLHPKIRVELVETVKEATPECHHYNWDAND